MPILERVRPPPTPDLAPGDPSPEPCAAAALCAPSLAMTREREMRGLRATSCFGFGGSTAGRGIFDGELAASTAAGPMIDVAAAVNEAWGAGDVPDEDAGLRRFVSGWLKILVGGGDIGLLARAMVALEEEARGWMMLARLGFCASATEERPEVRPDMDGFTAAAFASELAVGARREEVRFRMLLSGGDFPSALLEVDDARAFVEARLRRVPMDEAAVEVPAMLDRVPIDDTVLVRVVWREATVPVTVPLLLTRDRVVPTVVVDLTVPEGAAKEGMGERARELEDFVDARVPVDFGSAGFGLTSLLDVDDTEDAGGCEPEAFRVPAAADFDAASAFGFSPFLSAGAVGAFGTGMLEAGAGLALLPPPMFHTLRTSDFAEARKPNLDALALAIGELSV